MMAQSNNQRDRKLAPSTCFLLLVIILVSSLACTLPHQRMSVERMCLHDWGRAEVARLLGELEGDHLLTLEFFPLNDVFYVVDRWSDGNSLIYDIYGWPGAFRSDEQVAAGTIERQEGNLLRVDSPEAVRMFQQLYESAANLMDSTAKPVTTFIASRDPDRLAEVRCLIVTGRRQAWSQITGTLVLGRFRSDAERWDEELSDLDEGEAVPGGCWAAQLIKDMLRDEIAARPEVLLQELLDHFDTVVEVINNEASRKKQQSPGDDVQASEGITGNSQKTLELSKRGRTRMPGS